MAGQGLLPGFDAEPERTDRLFFAVLPDPALYRQIELLAEDLRSAHGLTANPVKSTRLHVSMHDLGDHAGMPDRLVELAGRAAASVAVVPFTLRFDRAMSFASRSRLSGGSPLVLCGDEGVVGLLGLHRALAESLARAGVRMKLGSATPHLTLLYDAKMVAQQTIAPVEWRVRDFVLLHTHIGKKQSYRVLGRWALPV
jgi:2'-5' RNA ligase